MSAAEQSEWKAPEADRVAATTPSAWKAPEADRQAAETPSALSRLGSAFWEGVGGKALLTMLGGASRDPEAAKKAADTAKSLVEGIKAEPGRVWDELSQSGQSMLGGHPVDAVSHLAKSVPVVGGGAATVQHDFENGDYATGFGHALALLLPFAVKGGAVSSVAESVPRAAGAVAAGAKAAAPDVAAGAGKVAAGAIASEVLPGGPLRYVAGAAPVYSGVRQIGRGLSKGFEAGKASLAERINAATEAMAAPEAAADEALLKFSGLSQEEFNGLKPQEQQAIRNLAANAQPAARPATPPPAPPQAAPVPAPAVAPAAPRSLTEMIQAEIAARNAQPPGRTPLRPPLAQPAPPPPESANVPPASAPRVPLSPPVGPAAPQSLAEAIAPPKPPSQAQIDAWMAKKAPAPLEEPRSMYTSTGERKSPELRAAEITGANVSAKAQRFVQALHDAGVTSADARSIPVGRLSVKQIQDGGMPGWGNIGDDLVSKGVLKAGENPPSQSIPEIVKGLKKLESQKIAAELADEMKRSGTVK